MRMSFGGREAREIQWVEFSQLFLEKFFPQHSRDRRYHEFLLLTQGSGSVEEYTMKFSELS